jgi:hypothetical protein
MLLVDRLRYRRARAIAIVTVGSARTALATRRSERLGVCEAPKS